MPRVIWCVPVVVLVVVIGLPVLGAPAPLQEYPVPRGGRPHDVAPAPDGGVWYTAQASGELGRLDPASGRTRLIKLGAGSGVDKLVVVRTP